jgi:hypothetical protein
MRMATDALMSALKQAQTTKVGNGTRALGRLVQECALAGKTELFAYFLPYFAAPEESEIPYEEMAQRSHRPVITLRHELARLRARYRAILREEVRGTVLEPTDVNDELRYLCYALAAA